MPFKEDCTELLDKCVLLNTYLNCYFLKKEYIHGYEIYYWMECFDNKSDLYSGKQRMRLPSCMSSMYTGREVTLFVNLDDRMRNSLLINEIVIANVDTNDRILGNSLNGFTEYNAFYPKLKNNLEKEANEN